MTTALSTDYTPNQVEHLARIREEIATAEFRSDDAMWLTCYKRLSHYFPKEMPQRITVPESIYTCLRIRAGRIRSSMICYDLSEKENEVLFLNIPLEVATQHEAAGGLPTGTASLEAEGAGTDALEQKPEGGSGTDAGAPKANERRRGKGAHRRTQKAGVK